MDGVLKLEVPVQAKDADIDVVLIVQSTPVADQANDRGWPPNFFEQTFGILRDAPLVREPQGEYEVRDSRR
jgi:hypothetical protein